MTESDIKVYWYYFKSLTKQLQHTEQYVDHSVNNNFHLLNGTVFSNEFAKLLFLSSSEFEVVCKSLCSESGIALRWNANIITLTKEILKKYPNIGFTQISTPFFSFKPLQDWKIMKKPNNNGKLICTVDGLQWWSDYNDIKHNRSSCFSSATLKNCVDSMASLMVLELYLSCVVLGNVDTITSIGCNYFDCKYGLSQYTCKSEITLPDFE